MATILEKMGHLKIWPTTYSKWHLQTSLAFNNLAVLHQRLRFLFMTATSKRIKSTISSRSNSCGDVAKFVANRCYTPECLHHRLVGMVFVQVEEFSAWLVFVVGKEVGSFGNLESLEHFVRQLSIAQQIEHRGCIQRTSSPQKLREV
jgi:hypothetical protein